METTFQPHFRPLLVMFRGRVCVTYLALPHYPTHPNIDNIPAGYRPLYIWEEPRVGDRIITNPYMVTSAWVVLNEIGERSFQREKVRETASELRYRWFSCTVRRIEEGR